MKRCPALSKGGAKIGTNFRFPTGLLNKAFGVIFIKLQIIISTQLEYFFTKLLRYDISVNQKSLA